MWIAAKDCWGPVHTCHVDPGEAKAGDYQDNTERSFLKLSVKEEPGLRHGRYCACLACARPWVQSPARQKLVVPT